MSTAKNNAKQNNCWKVTCNCQLSDVLDPERSSLLLRGNSNTCKDSEKLRVLDKLRIRVPLVFKSYKLQLHKVQYDNPCWKKLCYWVKRIWIGYVKLEWSHPQAQALLNPHNSTGSLNRTSGGIWIGGRPGRPDCGHAKMLRKWGCVNLRTGEGQNPKNVADVLCGWPL